MTIIKHHKTHQEQRRAAMPSIEDQLSAIWAGGAKMEEMRKRITAIQGTYPEPKESDPNHERRR